MRTTLTAVSAFALLASIAPATAADVYSSAKDPIVMSASGPVNWTGFYLGVNGGYGENVDSRDSTLTKGWSDSTSFWTMPVKGADPSGFLFGGQVGYLYQPSSNFVFGAEVSFSGTNVTGDAAATNVPRTWNDGSTHWAAYDTAMHQQLDYVGTITGVTGLTFGNAMVFAKGGLAFGQVQESVGYDGENSHLFSRTSIDTGWTVGGGLAYKLNPNWVFSVEYDYIDLGSHSLTGTEPGYDGGLKTFHTSDVSENFSIIKAAVNYQVGSVYQPLK